MVSFQAVSRLRFAPLCDLHSGDTRTLVKKPASLFTVPQQDRRTAAELQAVVSAFSACILGQSVRLISPELVL